MRTVRFAIVGCGKITERLALPQLAHNRHAAVAALIDINRTSALRMARQFHIDQRLVWTSWRRMLRYADVDAVAVNVPNALHAEIAVAALEAGKHVLVEKPIATTLADADAMIAAARRHRRVLMVEQTQRFDPAHETAHRLLRAGAIGAIREVRGRLGHAGPQYWAGTTKTWLTDRRLSGGGALMDVGAHIVDLLRWFSGKRIRRLCCRTSTLHKRLKVEEAAAAILEFEDGTLGAFDASWTTQPYEISTVCYGDRGTLRTSFGRGPRVALELSRRRGDPNQFDRPVQYPKVPDGSRQGGAYAAFIRSIRTSTPPLISGAEGRATLEVLLAAYESAKTRRWVELTTGRA
ncbi:MAG: hypothetical protein COV75_04390 [Candidatus Omnitrophica bacterium CG11_big_fil_rev_8_21_14_0_20_63_9]|nr:MAG: hypothetical protein COV75_04390 [Candidatus Omnitrophica bacterium CG11_big_fil_rev_8_21_14_0_20_63_9]